MGLSLSKVFRSVGKSLPGALGGFIAGGGPTPMGFIGAITGGLARKALPSPVAAGIPSIQSVTGVAPFFAAPQNGGLAVPTAGAAPAVVGALGIRLMTQNAARAILKLATIFGIPVALNTLARVGSRLWRTLIVFARRHPAISVLSMLTAMGLTVEEAGEFLMWGESTKRRRRGRGISARDIRTCRRTMRRMAAFQRDMFRAAPRRRGGRRGEGTIIAQN